MSHVDKPWQIREVHDRSQLKYVHGTANKGNPHCTFTVRYVKVKGDGGSQIQTTLRDVQWTQQIQMLHA